MKKTSPVSRSGRFSSGPGEDVAKFTESISFDRRLWRHDLLGSIAHATMLGSIGVLTKTEAKRITKALEAIGDDIEAGRFDWDESLEDVHMNIEAELTRREPVGAKLQSTSLVPISKTIVVTWYMLGSLSTGLRGPV